MEQLRRLRGRAQPTRAYSVLYQQPDFQGLWNKEYARNSTIPSSNRSDPAHALVEMVNENPGQRGIVAYIIMNSSLTRIIREHQSGSDCGQ